MYNNINNVPDVPGVDPRVSPGGNVANWLNRLGPEQLAQVGDLEILNASINTSGASGSLNERILNSSAPSSEPPPSPGNAPLNCSGGSGLSAVKPPSFNSSSSPGGSSGGDGADPLVVGGGNSPFGRVPAYNQDYFAGLGIQRLELQFSPLIPGGGNNTSPLARGVPPVGPGTPLLNCSGGSEGLSGMNPPSLNFSGAMSLIGDRDNALDVSGNSGLSGINEPSFNSSGSGTSGTPYDQRMEPMPGTSQQAAAAVDRLPCNRVFDSNRLKSWVMDTMLQACPGCGKAPSECQEHTLKYIMGLVTSWRNLYSRGSDGRFNFLNSTHFFNNNCPLPPNNTPNSTPNNTPNSTPNNTSNSTPNNTPNSTPKNTPNKSPNNS